MKYFVHVKEVWTRTLEVEAESKEEAIDKANDLIELGAQELEFDYSHTLEPDMWTIFNATKDDYEQ